MSFWKKRRRGLRVVVTTDGRIAPVFTHVLYAGDTVNLAYAMDFELPDGTTARKVTELRIRVEEVER